jgi:hypothetical protein
VTSDAVLSRRRRVVAGALLLTGLGIALAIFLTAAAVPADPLGADPGNSKQYLREMELYGGKANLLASEFREWLESLLHGRRLAGTVVFVTLAVVLLYLVGSTPLPQEEGPPPPAGPG